MNKTKTYVSNKRLALLSTLATLRDGTLTPKEADAVEAAIEDELIALRGSSLLSGGSI